METTKSEKVSSDSWDWRSLGFRNSETSEEVSWPVKDVPVSLRRSPRTSLKCNITVFNVRFTRFSEYFRHLCRVKVHDNGKGAPLSIEDRESSH